MPPPPPRYFAARMIEEREREIASLMMMFRFRFCYFVYENERRDCCFIPHPHSNSFLQYYIVHKLVRIKRRLKNIHFKKNETSIYKSYDQLQC